jgi:hypothetical protein
VIVDIETYERLLEAYEELEDIRVDHEAVAQLEAGVIPKPLEEGWTGASGDGFKSFRDVQQANR